jgi:hypothetical protein
MVLDGHGAKMDATGLGIKVAKPLYQWRAESRRTANRLLALWKHRHANWKKNFGVSSSSQIFADRERDDRQPRYRR